MGLALDTVGFSRTAGGGGVDATFQPSVLATGDSATVRNFSQQSKAHLLDVFGQYVTLGAQFRVKSPLFHDNTQGIKVIPGETPIRYSIPQNTDQMLHPQDNLTIEQISNLASEVVAGGLEIYYEDLPGTAARLYSWGDFAGLIKNIKPMLVASPEAAAAGQWNDTVITTSEDLLKANTDYAVLGYTTDLAECMIALKGPDLGNLRAGGPGDVRTINVQDYFIELSKKHGLPMIPVINAANKNATYVSIFSQTTGHTPKVQIILAELARNLN